MILGTQLSANKWRALFLLVMGCTLVVSPLFTQTPSSSSSSGKQMDSATERLLKIIGYLAVLGDVVLSGFASIYFERVIKSSTEVVTIWERNFQLSFYSLIVYAVIVFWKRVSSSSSHASGPLFARWSLLTFSVAATGAAGGLLVGATLKYADSIMKTLATAGGIVFSTLLGHFLLQGPLDVIMVIGAMVTITAITNYTFDVASTSASSLLPTIVESRRQSLDILDEGTSKSPLLNKIRSNASITSKDGHDV